MSPLPLLKDSDRLDMMPPKGVLDAINGKGFDPHLLTTYKYMDGDKSKDFYMGIIEATRVIQSFINHAFITSLPGDLLDDIITDYGASAIFFASKK